MTTTRALSERATGTLPPQRDEDLLSVETGVLDQLVDTVVHDLFGLGLHLHSVLPLLDEEARQRVNAAIEETDRLIRRVRDVRYATAAQGR